MPYFGSWLARVLVESVLIVLSILLALAVDGWQQNREHEHLARQSLESFQREIGQNRARMEDLHPFRSGVHDVLVRLESTREIRSAEQFQAAIGAEPFRPAFLTNTAWEAAVATGVLTYIPYELVAALSMTYSLQERYEQRAETAMPALVRGVAVPDPGIVAALRSTIGYLNDLKRQEEELQAVYTEVLAMLETELGREAGQGQTNTPASASPTGTGFER